MNDTAQREGSRTAERERILASCYEDMRRLARGIIASDALRLVLQPTDLAHEAALRLLQSPVIDIGDRGHMLALAARTMRRVLIDESRKLARAKRRVPELLTHLPGAPPTAQISVEDLDRALAALERFSADHAQIVELRFSLGMTVEETAAATGIPVRTVKRRWQAARAWLQDHLSHGADRS